MTQICALLVAAASPRRHSPGVRFNCAGLCGEPEKPALAMPEGQCPFAFAPTLSHRRCLAARDLLLLGSFLPSSRVPPQNWALGRQKGERPAKIPRPWLSCPPTPTRPSSVAPSAPPCSNRLLVALHLYSPIPNAQRPFQESLAGKLETNPCTLALCFLPIGQSIVCGHNKKLIGSNNQSLQLGIFTRHPSMSSRIQCQVELSITEACAKILFNF